MQIANCMDIYPPTPYISSLPLLTLHPVSSDAKLKARIAALVDLVQSEEIRKVGQAWGVWEHNLAS